MTTALIVTTYNRPEYLKRCLESLQALSDWPDFVLIADDASTDKEVKKILNEFQAPVPYLIQINTWNIGIKERLQRCIAVAVASLPEIPDLIINLDSDAIVKPNFITELKRLHAEHPDHIISGFNSANKNPDGSLRNPIIEEHTHYLLKKHANGINMAFTVQQYEETIKPALQSNGNWDTNTANAGKPFVIAKPSLVQHIGLKSTMGHDNDPDVACDFYELELPDVTLFGIDSHNPAGLKRAAEISCQSILFGAVEIITEKLFEGREGYSRFCIEKMAEYVHTSHVLIVHADGYVQNPSAWKNEWLQYDYIGATWWYKDGMNNGNGGFSLRSKKLLDILASLDLKEYHPEDHVICRQLRPWLEKEYGIKFAPDEVCNQFSIEAYNVPAPDNAYNGQFGFHGYHVSGLNFPMPTRQRPVEPPKQYNSRWRK